MDSDEQSTDECPRRELWWAIYCSLGRFYECCVFFASAEIEKERSSYSSLHQAYGSLEDKISNFRFKEESHSRHVEKLKQQVTDVEKSNQSHKLDVKMADVEKRYYERNIADLKDQLSHEKMKSSCTIMWISVPSL